MTIRQGGFLVKIASTVILITCLLAAPTFGQAQFTGKGGSSAGASLSYTGNELVKGFALEAAFSPVNMLDLGISGINYTGDNDAIAVAPYLGVWLINENNGDVPLSLCASLSFGYLFRREGYSDGDWISAMSLSAHKNIVISESSMLQPYIGSGVADAQRSESEASLLAGLAFFTRTGSRNGLVLSNGYAVSDGTLTVSLSIGFVGGTRLAGTHSSDWDAW